MSGEVDRRTAERVLARAVELGGPGRDPQGLSHEQLVAIGSELGIDEAHVRRALAEVQASPRVGALDRSVTVTRRVELGADEADRLVAAWFERGDGMRVLRHVGPEHGSWAPRTGMVAGTRAALARAGGADLELRETRGVTACVEPAGDGASRITLSAHVKRDYAASAAIVGGGGTVAAVVASVVLWPPLLLGVAAAGAGAYGLLRAQRSESELIALALERRLDLVSTGREPGRKGPSVTGAFDRVRAAAAGRTRKAGAGR